MSGARQYGDLVAREVSQRFGGAFDDADAIEALGPKYRAHGMMVVNMDGYSLWVFDSASESEEDDNVLVPDEGTGRWHACTLTVTSGG